MKIEEKADKLIITDFSDLEAYKIAVTIEKNGIFFYEKLAAQQIGEKDKETILFLLGEERKHLKFFETLLNKVRSEKESNEDEDLLESFDYGIFWPYENMEDVPGIVQDKAKALKLAALVENKSVEFYSKCRENVSAQETKRELEKIIEEEKKHKALFAAMLEKYKNGN